MTGGYTLEILCLMSLEYFFNIECGKCDQEWMNWEDGEACYYTGLGEPTRLNFTDANLFCSEKDAFLLSVASPEELHFLNSTGLLDRTQEYWLGLTKDNPVSIHTTLADKRSGWRWLDGSNTTWMKWNPGPDNFEEPTGDSKCVKISQNGLWYDHPCNAVLWFLCERKHSRVTTYPAVTTEIDKSTPPETVRSTTTATIQSTTVTSNNISYRPTTKTAGGKDGTDTWSTGEQTTLSGSRGTDGITSADQQTTSPIHERPRTDTPQVETRHTEAASINAKTLITNGRSTDSLQSTTLVDHSEEWPRPTIEHRVPNENGTRAGNGTNGGNSEDKIDSTWVMAISISSVGLLVIFVIICAYICRSPRKRKPVQEDGEQSSSGFKEITGQGEGSGHDKKIPMYENTNQTVDNHTYASSLPTPQKQTSKSPKTKSYPKKKSKFAADYYNEPDVFPY